MTNKKMSRSNPGKRGRRYVACSLAIVLCVLAAGTAGMGWGFRKSSDRKTVMAADESVGAVLVTDKSLRDTLAVDEPAGEAQDSGRRGIEQGDSMPAPEGSEKEEESESESESESEWESESESESRNESESEPESESESELRGKPEDGMGAEAGKTEAEAGRPEAEAGKMEAEAGGMEAETGGVDENKIENMTGDIGGAENETGNAVETEKGDASGKERGDAPGNVTWNGFGDAAGEEPWYDGEMQIEPGSGTNEKAEDAPGSKAGSGSEPPLGDKTVNMDSNVTGPEYEEKNGNMNGAESGNETGSGAKNTNEDEPENINQAEASLENDSGNTPGEEAVNSDSDVTGLEDENAPETESKSETESKEAEAGIGETETGIGEAETEGKRKNGKQETKPVQEDSPETEAVPEKVKRGKDYELVGDQGAWYRDSEDRLWVRSGTSLYVQTTGAGDYSEGAGKHDLKEDGTIVFSLKKTDSSGTVIKESAIATEAYYVDGEAPRAKISVSGSEENGIIYAAQSAELSFAIAPDGKSGLKAASYTLLRCSADGMLLDDPEKALWTPCGNGSQAAVREEGVFRAYVRTEDHVGNLAFSESGLFCVDRRPPEVTIEGVGNQTANSGEVRIRVAAKDEHYKRGSMKVDLTGINGRKTPMEDGREETQEGMVVEYSDIPAQKEYDDIYQLYVRAEDAAGNVAEKRLEFSVNRFGSVYDLDSSTKENLSRYFLTQAEDVVFYETNIDYVGESRIFCRQDGTLCELKRGKDYQVTMQGSRDSWKQYRYTVPAAYFSKEGIYELLLSSEDAADNKSDTGIQEKRVAFALDWTAPGCTLTGIEQQVYQAESLTASLTPYDNIGLRTVRVYRDSELFLEETSVQDSDKTMDIPLRASEDWQTLQVYLCDMAGNEYWTEEMPVYLAERTGTPPEYRKIRMSAKEKAQRRADVAETKLLGADSAQEGQRHVEKLYAGGVASVPESSARRALDRGKLEGNALLIFGLLVFAATAAACGMTGRQKKK